MKYLWFYLGQGTADTLFSHVYFDSKEEAIQWLRKDWIKLHYPINTKNYHVEFHKIDNIPNYHLKVINKITKTSWTDNELCLYEINPYKL